MMLDKVVPCRRMGNSSEMRLLLHNMEMVIEVKLDDEIQLLLLLLITRPIICGNFKLKLCKWSSPKNMSKNATYFYFI